MVAATAELEQTYTPEIIDRRTDDLLYNVRFLQKHIIDRQRGLFNPKAEADGLEQTTTDVAEADIHELGVPVNQDRDELTGQYVSLDVGTISNNLAGLRALDMADERVEFEVFRRIEEVAEEELILWPDMQAGMSAGGVKVFVSTKPTHHEVDPDVAASFNYDDRDMLRLQMLSPDCRRKTMISFSIFEVPVVTWAAFLSDRYQQPVEAKSLCIMQFCHGLPLEFKSVPEILQDFVGGVAEYLPPKERSRVLAQLDSFLTKQAELAKQAEYYGREKLGIQKQLALCLDDWASPAILAHINNLRSNLNSHEKIELSKRFVGGRLWVDEHVAKLVVKAKTVTTNNRAGLAVGNHRTMLRLASRVGLETALAMAEREQYIQQLPMSDATFMTNRADQQIAEIGVGCGGGCSVRVENLFSSDAIDARKAGLKGTLYSSKEVDKNSQCSCSNKTKARVLVDGKNAYCSTCKDFVVNGKRGNLTDRSKANKS